MFSDFDNSVVGIELASLLNEVVATIYGQNITEKDLALYEAYSDEGNTLDNVIEHKIITKKAKENNIILNQNDIKSMQQYKEDLEKSNIYEMEIFKVSGLTKEQFIAIKLELYEHILIASNYEYEILEKLREGTLNSDNHTINNKISKFNTLYNKWANEWLQGKESNVKMEDIYNLQEEIVEDYLQYIVKQEELAI